MQPASHLACKGLGGGKVPSMVRSPSGGSLPLNLLFLSPLGHPRPAAAARFHPASPSPSFPGKSCRPAPPPLPAWAVPGLIGYGLLQALKDEKPSTGEVLSVHGLLMVSHHYVTFQALG